MNIKQIKELAEIVKDYNLSSLELDGEKITIKRENNVVAMPQTICNSEIATAKEQNLIIETPQKVIEGKLITAPTVGVFYSSPSPDSKAYASVGDTVKVGDVLCIIEAMKLMNEIQADCDGEIVEVLAQNGDVVEFGQALFRVK